MNIEAGKFYKASNGGKVGPMSHYAEPYADAPFWYVHDQIGRWNDCGVYILGEYNDLNLICEWKDEALSPVREKVVKEIVPGTYGKIIVTGTYTKTNVTMAFKELTVDTAVSVVGMNAQELRDAAKVFIELADYLDGEK